MDRIVQARDFVLSNPERLIFILPLIILIIYVIVELNNVFKELRNRRRFTIVKSNESELTKIREWLMQFKFSERLIKLVGNKISMLNSHSFEVNYDYAVILIAVGVTILLIVESVLLFRETIWYLSIAYTIMAGIMLSIFFYMFAYNSKVTMLKELPRAYRLFLTKMKYYSDVSMILGDCAEELSGALKREFYRFKDLVSENDPRRIEEVFTVVEENYDIKYFNLLILLIRHLHEYGNADEVAQSFETIKVELENEIEYRKNISMSTRLYSAMAVIIGVAAYVTAGWFTEKVLGAEMAKYYTKSVQGNMYELALSLSVVIVVVILIVYERSVE